MIINKYIDTHTFALRVTVIAPGFVLDNLISITSLFSFALSVASVVLKNGQNDASFHACVSTEDIQCNLVHFIYIWYIICRWKCAILLLCNIS